MKLTIKQRKLVDEYIISGNKYQSALKAGYAKASAPQIADETLKKPHVKAYLDERIAQLESEKIASQKEVLEYLTSVMRGESSSTEMVVEGIGEGCSEARLINKPPTEKERTKAAELLGKRYGTWTEKIDLDAELRTVVVDDLEEDS